MHWFISSKIIPFTGRAPLRGGEVSGDCQYNSFFLHHRAVRRLCMHIRNISWVGHSHLLGSLHLDVRRSNNYCEESAEVQLIVAVEEFLVEKRKNAKSIERKGRCDLKTREEWVRKRHWEISWIMRSSLLVRAETLRGWQLKMKLNSDENCFCANFAR